LKLENFDPLFKKKQKPENDNPYSIFKEQL
jgi:hypothetical protein